MLHTCINPKTHTSLEDAFARNALRIGAKGDTLKAGAVLQDQGSGLDLVIVLNGHDGRRERLTILSRSVDGSGAVRREKNAGCHDMFYEMQLMRYIQCLRRKKSSALIERRSKEEAQAEAEVSFICSH